MPEFETRRFTPQEAADIFKPYDDGISVVKKYHTTPLGDHFIDPVTERTLVAETAQLFQEKGFSPDALEFLAEQKVLADLYSNLVLKQNSSTLPNVNIVLKKSLTFSRRHDAPITYTGTPEENREIDVSIKESGSKNDVRRGVTGHGAARFFNTGISPETRTLLKEQVFSHTKIVIIGAGPAGILAARTLIEHGCPKKNIKVIDRLGKYNGIWNNPNVHEGQKNNPFYITYEQSILGPAPGPGTSVRDFLDELTGKAENPKRRKTYRTALPDPIRGVVTQVTPGDLEHKITYKQGNQTHTIQADIVINAMGNSRPLPLTKREGYIEFDMTEQEAGYRWQQTISLEKAKKWDEEGKVVVVIGLGNSWVEIQRQLDAYRKDHGIDIPAVVLTHYPALSLAAPNETVFANNQNYRLARNLKRPDLTKLALDLSDVADLYHQAYYNGRMLPDVTKVGMDDVSFIIETRSGSNIRLNKENIQLFTLIGYGQNPDAVRNMGMIVSNEVYGTPATDYDGEVQKATGVTGQERVHKGYYALGTLLKSPHDPNATVIPGIQFRLPDQLFGVIERSVEVAQRKGFAKSKAMKKVL